MKKIVSSLIIISVSIIISSYLIFADSSDTQNLSLTLISNVTLYHSNYSCFLGKCGKIIEKRDNFSSEGFQVGYLFEGESGEFDVQASSITLLYPNLMDVYMTLGQEKGPGNMPLAEIYNEAGWPWNPETASYASCTRIPSYGNDTNSNFHCKFKVLNSYYEHGEYFLGVDAEMRTGEIIAMNDLGNPFFNGVWFLNPTLGVSSNPYSINFNESEIGKRIYSEPIAITNTCEPGFSIQLNMSLSGKGVYDNFARELNCPANSTFNISYFVSNGEYNTSFDSGADSEGFIKLPYNNEAVINNSQVNILAQYSSHILFTFRLDIPKECKGGELNNTSVRIIGTEPSSLQNTFIDVPVKLKTYLPNCSSADFNFDGSVDYLDLANLAGSWNMCNKTHQQGDTNGDGCVDLLDLGNLAGRWNTATGPCVYQNISMNSTQNYLPPPNKQLVTLSTGVFNTDMDKDGVSDIWDYCQNTAKKAAVNKQGCSQKQFCSTITIDKDKKVCTNAVWNPEAKKKITPCSIIQEKKTKKLSCITK